MTSFFLPPLFPVQSFLFVGGFSPPSRAIMTANAPDNLDANDRRIAWLGHWCRGNESRFISP